MFEDAGAKDVARLGHSTESGFAPASLSSWQTNRDHVGLSCQTTLPAVVCRRASSCMRKTKQVEAVARRLIRQGKPWRNGGRLRRGIRAFRHGTSTEFTIRQVRRGIWVVVAAQLALIMQGFPLKKPILGNDEVKRDVKNSNVNPRSR